MSNNNSTSPSDNSTTAESSTDSNSSGSSTDSTPITPTTDLGKAWMRYATYITEGEAREEGLSGEYSEFLDYYIYSALGSDLATRQVYFQQAQDLFNNFYTAYQKSADKTSELTAAIEGNRQYLLFLTYAADVIILGGTAVIGSIEEYGADATNAAATAQYEPFNTLSNNDLKNFGNLLTEDYELTLEMYNYSVNSGCWVNSQIPESCYSNPEFNDYYSQLYAQSSEVEGNILSTYNKALEDYLRSLWAVADQLQEIKNG